MNTVPSSSSELLARFESANLLAKCGGPYPDESGIVSLPTLSDAIDIIGGSQLDAIAHSQWDRQGVSARRQATAILRKQEGIHSWLFAPRRLAERERFYQNQTMEKVEVWKNKAGVPDIEGRVVNEHLAILFFTASLVLDAGLSFAWPLILEATRFALWGYLPVDFSVEGGLERVIIF